jgi:hypothetical protein
MITSCDHDVALGVYQAADHPLLEELVRYLDELSPDEWDPLVGSDQLDAFAYELAQRLYPPAVEESVGEEPLGWVTAEQVAALEGIWAADWPAALSADLERRWTDWNSHPAEHKVAWLTDLIATGAFSAVAPAQSEPQPAKAEALMDDLAALVDDIPGFEELSSEEIAEVIAEVLQKLEG